WPTMVSTLPVVSARARSTTVSRTKRSTTPRSSVASRSAGGAGRDRWRGLRGAMGALRCWPIRPALPGSNTGAAAGPGGRPPVGGRSVVTVRGSGQFLQDFAEQRVQHGQRAGAHVVHAAPELGGHAQHAVLHAGENRGPHALHPCGVHELARADLVL